ncbi:polyketide synthase dehydratase domain-containing protein, partial [Streptomyces sp. 2MCAF27]
IRIFSRPSGTEDGWICHAVGVLGPRQAGADDAGLGGPWPPRGAETVDLTGLYERAETRGYGYGPRFRGLRALWRDGRDLIAEIVLPEGTGGNAEGFGIHPVLLDAALQPALLTDDTADDTAAEERLWLPFTWSGVSLWATGAGRVRVRLSPREPDGEDERGLRIALADTAGAPVLSAESVVLRPSTARQLQDIGGAGATGLFAVGWTPLAAPRTDAGTEPSADGHGPWVALGDPPQQTDLEQYGDLATLLTMLDAG